MELLFITLAGAIIGLAGRYLLPHRHTHGAALMPAIGVIASAVLWVGLTWAGLKWDGGWIWVITLLGTAAIVVITDLVIGRVRTTHDANLLATLSKASPVPAR
jgi:NADPH-dependent 2,4-dienoyl-CoA reductase/sulfur reductase-like enzyme